MRPSIRTPLVCLFLACAICVSFLLSLHIGSTTVSQQQVWDVVLARLQGQMASDETAQAVIWELRTPRSLLALIVGAGLAVSGVIMQTLVRNPLADPYLLGISAGASVGATAVLVFGTLASMGLYALSIGAMLGALLATITVYLVTIAQGGLTPLRLILSGVVLSSAFSAIASFLVFKGPDPRAAQGVMFWMLGSVTGAQWQKLSIPFIVMLVLTVFMWFLARQLDALAAGPDTAAALGVRVGLLRKVLFFAQALLVGTMVAVAGGIGFVGLVIPHIARRIVGPLHRRLLPVAALLGALFLIWVDVLARIAAPPQEIPLGVVTGIIGAPMFLLLMGRKQYNFGGQG